MPPACADLPRAPRGGRARRPSGAPSWARDRRARSARSGGRPRPRAAVACLHPACAVDAARLAGLSLVPGPTGRLPRPRQLPRRPRRPRRAPRPALEGDRSRPGDTILGGFSMGAVMSYAMALGADRPPVAGILAFSGFVPVVEGWEPELEDRRRDPGLHRPWPCRSGDRDRLRPPRQRPACGGRARGRVPRVRRRAPDRPLTARRCGGVAGPDRARSLARGKRESPERAPGALRRGNVDLNGEMLRAVVTVQVLDEAEDAAAAQMTVHGPQVPDRERGGGRFIGRVADRQLQLVAFPLGDGLAVGAAQDALFRGDGRTGGRGLLAAFGGFFVADFLDFARR